MHTIKWKNAIIAGIIGTLLFDLVGLLISGQWWDIPTLLGNKTGLGMTYGVLAHFGNGVLLAILYTGIFPSLWGPHWLRPFIFITTQVIALVWLFMFPLLGAGVAGIDKSPMMAVGSMLRHWVYVVPFIYIIHRDLSPKVKDE